MPQGRFDHHRETVAMKGAGLTDVTDARLCEASTAFRFH